MGDSIRLEKAKVLYEEYKRKKDKSLLDEAVKLLQGDDSVASLNQLGLIYTELERYQEAEEVFRKALRKTKNEEDLAIIKFNLAICLFKKKDLTSAYEILKELSVTKNVMKVHSQRLLAKVCLAMGDIKHVDEARAILENFDEPTEDLIVSYIYLARNGRREYLKKAIELAQLLGNKRLLAEALLSSEAEEDLEKALVLFRELKDVKGEARALYKLSFYNKELLYEALQKLEEYGEGTDSDKVRLLNELYKRTNLVDFLKKAISYAEKANETLFLARAYVELSKHENEVENLRKAVKYYEEFISKYF
ncbi:tetratricopeptide repeat protein [Stygiolobus sp. RP850M]|jgi:tetratricopeptide (TPR) repeat protein|uniref:tetratricopeptide repeat protein n=1 Tax=Stygiolobus sp. RP850M TaxID=3133137 RepID=UPI00307D36DB